MLQVISAMSWALSAWGNLLGRDMILLLSRRLPGYARYAVFLIQCRRISILLLRMLIRPWLHV